jgi:hypothetical protein
MAFVPHDIEAKREPVDAAKDNGVYEVTGVDDKPDRIRTSEPLQCRDNVDDKNLCVRIGPNQWQHGNDVITIHGAEDANVKSVRLHPGGYIEVEYDAAGPMRFGASIEGATELGRKTFEGFIDAIRAPIQPSHIIVPPKLEATARELLESDSVDEPKQSKRCGDCKWWDTAPPEAPLPCKTDDDEGIGDVAAGCFEPKEQEPKFKVGDRVRVDNAAYVCVKEANGKIGTIVSVDNTTVDILPYKVDVNGDVFFFGDRHLELISQEPEYVGKAAMCSEGMHVITARDVIRHDFGCKAEEGWSVYRIGETYVACESMFRAGGPECALCARLSDCDDHNKHCCERFTR